MIGREIGHYRILEKLGEGGMGVVYKAEDLDLKVTRALKFLPHQTATDEDQLARLQREARAAASLEHPNICPVHEIGREDGHTFIVMSYLQGRTLEDRLTEEGPLPVDQALNIAAQVGSALSRAHAAGVVHRDIKPANIMLTDEGQAVVMDFGLARATDLSRLTRTGTALGTASYMSPEQANGQTVDAQADIWALGVVLYEMLTGRLPFGGDQLAGIFYAIMNKEPDPVTESRPDASPDLERTIDRALAKDPGQRYQTADELLADLVAVRDREELGQKTARYDRRRKLKRRKRTLYGGLATVALALAALIWWSWYQEAHRIDAIAVLPFLNLSGDPGKEYLADGMTEQLITELQQLGAGTALRVIGRTSVMRFKESDLTLPEIADRLGVDAMVEASVRQEEGRLVIIAKLIRARPEQQMWVDTFERTMREAPALQASIAETLFDQIGQETTAEASERIHARAEREIVPEAYQAYLQGRHFLSLTTVASVERAVASFEKAIRLDPNFAQAYAALAEAHAMLIQIAPLPPGEACAGALAPARKAIELDPSLAEAYAILSDALASCGGSDQEIDRLSAKALELAPENPRALLYRAQNVGWDQGEPVQGLRLMRRAFAADPFSPFISANIVWQLVMQNDLEEAEEQFARTMELDPGNWVARWALGFGYEGAGRYEEAVQVCQESLDLSFKDEEGSPEALPQLVPALVALGRSEEILVWKNRLDRISGQRYVPGLFRAFASAGLGLEEETLGHLAAAVREEDFRLIWWLGGIKELLYGEAEPPARFREIMDRVYSG